MTRRIRYPAGFFMARINMPLEFINFEFKELAEEVKYRKKKKLGSYPYLSVLVSISLALFVIGLFGILIFQANRLISMVRENIEVQVFLNKNISENDIIRVRNVLSNAAYIARTDNKPGIKFISRKQAAEIFVRETGEDFREFLDDNPLRDAYIIHLTTGYQHTDSLAMIKKQLEAVPGISDVQYIESLIDSINENVTKISFILLGISVVLLFIVAVLINNTIKLAMFSQRFLIRSMQLVGANPSFIVWPFLKRSILHGITSGVVASVGLFLLLTYAGNRIQGLSRLNDVNELLYIFSGITILGIVIAFFSTLRAINKYLKMSLDELY
jgi:cell division transport system permease protein